MNISELNKELEKRSLSGYWIWRDNSVFNEGELPYLWKWQDVHDCLMMAKDVVGFDVSERRSVQLINPNVPGRSTSKTIQFDFSIVKPGETARAHRHNLAAIRFVVQGKGAYTMVEGERFPMEEGDLILTPNWTWHDHFNGSDEPIIWLDGLDVPLVRSLNMFFFENYHQEVQPVSRPEGDSNRLFAFSRRRQAPENVRRGVPFRYDWQATYATLKSAREDEIDPCDGTLLRYVNPVTGGYTLPTMSCDVQLLPAGKPTKTHRHTSTTIYHVFKGNGRTAVGEGYLEWKKGDSFLVPLWQWHCHESRSAEEAILFSMNDRPVMEALELYREETAPTP